jgi:SAM-dependent methyltransferase
MEAFLELTGVGRVIGLDVAPGMIRLAKQRMFRDRLDARRYQFVLYNGEKLPWPDGAIDFFYSVATFQHIPKPHAYQLLLEMQRCLSPSGVAVVQFAAWSQLQTWPLSFADEVRGQLEGRRRHWHLFYGRDELDALFRWVLRPPRCHLLHTADGNFWAAWTKTVV